MISGGQYLLTTLLYSMRIAYFYIFSGCLDSKLSSLPSVSHTYLKLETVWLVAP